MAGWTDEELRAAVKAYKRMVDQQESGSAFNKKEVYRSLVEQYGRSVSAWEYRMQNISAVMADLGLRTVIGLMPAKNVGAGVTTRLVNIIGVEDSKDVRRFKYGSKRTWELALDAILELGGVADLAQVTERALLRTPTLKSTNVGADLNLLSVNSPARVSYPGADTPRRTDQGALQDKLYKVGEGRHVTYALYSPDVHGVWEIFQDVDAGNMRKMSVRRITDPSAAGLTKARQSAIHHGVFDTHGLQDAREWVYASIVRRQGQPAFRKSLLAAYEGKCAVTGCDVKDVLEAAHVHPYKGKDTNVIGNGLLLRADIHTLFDLYQISVDPESRVVQLSPSLLMTTYGPLNGVAIRRPKDAGDQVSPAALEWHRSQCSW